MKRNYLSEYFGTAFLTMIVLGSGLKAQKLFPGQEGLALLANSLATGAGLFALIHCLTPLSGAHINPVVSLAELVWQGLNIRTMTGYLAAQLLGALSGVALVHLMFAQDLLQPSHIQREGSHLLVAELIATFGLVSVVALAKRRTPEFTAIAVTAYVTAAYWFTSSTGFSNPALTLARCFTESFGGMSPQHLLSFVCAQTLGALLASALWRESGGT